MVLKKSDFHSYLIRQAAVEVFLCNKYCPAYFYNMILQSASGLKHFPKRIVSLVPSQTELLHYLGLEQETVGITKFCVHPEEWFTTKTKIGGTKAIKKDIIQHLQPDLIIANKEENVREQVEELAKDYPVWVTDVNDLDDALQMINDIGELTGKAHEAGHLVLSIKKEFNELKKLSTANYQLSTAYLIWRNPYMTIGGDTFINNMLAQCGFQNVFAGNLRYPEVTVTQLQTTNHKLLLLSSEPYPFKQKHINELQSQLPGCKIMLVDGEMFSWYGSRLLLAPQYFKTLIHSILESN